MNEIFKYWFEYNGANGQHARKILTSAELKANIETHLASYVKFMEDHMIFPNGEPESDVFKRTFHIYFFLVLPLESFLCIPR